MLSSLPKLAYFSGIDAQRDKQEKMRRVKEEYFREYSDTDFLHAFLLSECMIRQKETGVSAKIILSEIVPKKELDILYESYKANRFVDEDNKFTPVASEYNIYCLFSKP